MLELPSEGPPNYIGVWKHFQQSQQKECKILKIKVRIQMLQI